MCEQCVIIAIFKNRAGGGGYMGVYITYIDRGLVEIFLNHVHRSNFAYEFLINFRSIYLTRCVKIGQG